MCPRRVKSISTLLCEHKITLIMLLCEGLLALMWSMSKSDAYYSNKSVSVMGYYEVE